MKAIIIAQPKTASTSLLVSLGELTGYTICQAYYARRPTGNLRQAFEIRLLASYREYYRLRHVWPATNYGIISKFHSDICDLVDLDRISSLLKADIHKQHFPPTESNIRALRHVKKILLTRGAIDTMKSYQKVPSNAANSSLKARLQSENFRNLLLDELLYWKDGWLRAAAETPREFLTIRYEELVKSPICILEQIMQFLDVSAYIPPNYKLPKKRVYTSGLA